MPFSKPQIRLSFLHDIVDTDEVAQFDISLARTDSGGISIPISSTLQNIAGHYTTAMTAAGLNRAEYSRFLGVKAAQLGTDGNYTADPAIYQLATPASGSAVGVPPQMTIAVSLQSGQSLGKGNYGRIYIPHVLPAFSSGTPYLASTRPGLVAAAFAAMVASINGEFSAITGTPRVTIMSQAGATPTAKPVTLVRCGRVMDTQRRRRNRLTENYVSATVA